MAKGKLHWEFQPRTVSNSTVLPLIEENINVDVGEHA